MGFFEKLERKFGKYAIKNLMFYIIVLYTVGVIINEFMYDMYANYLSLNVYEIIHNFQVWRLFTFIIQPPNSNLIFMIFTLYLYYMIGTSLERVWGAFRFNVYFFMGVIFQILAAFLVYFIFGMNLQMSTYYLNLSLFLAFACVYPDMELLLFFIIPIKMKWLGIIDGVFFGYTVIGNFYSGFYYNHLMNNAASVNDNVKYQYYLYRNQSFANAISALVAVLNFLIFFLMTRNYRRISPQEIKRKRDYRKVQKFERQQTSRVHKCCICGRNSEEFPDLSFRYCSKCSGNKEYCQDHLFTHEHK